MAENSRLPVPKEAFLAVVNHLAIEVLVGNLEVAKFDSAVNGLLAVPDEELQAELVQVKLIIKRGLVDAS